MKRNRRAASPSASLPLALLAGLCLLLLVLWWLQGRSSPDSVQPASGALESTPERATSSAAPAPQAQAELESGRNPATVETPSGASSMDGTLEQGPAIELLVLGAADAPLQGATLTTPLGARQRSDREGRVRLPFLDWHQQLGWVSLTHEQYLPLQASIGFAPEPLVLRMQLGLVLGGRVLLPGGQPAAFARVYNLVDNSGWDQSSFREQRQTHADAQGRFELVGLDPRAVVVAQLGELESEPVLVQVAEQGQELVLRLEAQRELELELDWASTARDPSVSLVAKARCSLPADANGISFESGKRLRVEALDASGEHWRLCGIPRGASALELEAAGRFSSTVRRSFEGRDFAELLRTGRARIELCVDLAALEIVLRAAGRLPPSIEAQLNLYHLGDYQTSVRALPSEQGLLSAERVPSGMPLSCVLTWVAPRTGGGFQLLAPLSLPQLAPGELRRVELEVPALWRVEVDCVDARGEPWPTPLWLWLRQAGERTGGWTDDPPGWETLGNQPLGRARRACLWLPEGRYRVRPNCFGQDGEELEFSLSADIQLRLNLGPQSSVRGRALGDDGRVLEQQSIALNLPHGMQPAFTASDGSFEFEGVPISGTAYLLRMNENQGYGSSIALELGPEPIELGDVRLLSSSQH